jgi:hypothetical protein
MSVLEIENELQKMNNKELKIVVEIATKLIRGKKQKESLDEKRSKLKTSAEIMFSEYENDADLTALTALDSEELADA